MTMLDERGVLNALDVMGFPFRAEFVVFGEAVLALRGLRTVPYVDVLVNQRIWDFCSARNWTLRYGEAPASQVRYLESPSGLVRVYRDATVPGMPLSFESPGALETVMGLQCMSLRTLARWKAAYGRPEDLVDVAAIERWMK